MKRRTYPSGHVFVVTFTTEYRYIWSRYGRRANPFGLLNQGKVIGFSITDKIITHFIADQVLRR
jgi:hypothetical protein